MSKVALLTTSGGIRVAGIFAADKAEDKHGPGEFSDYAAFNRGPHLCLDVEGMATLSVRLADGKQVTFAFVGSLEKDVDPMVCVDICVKHDCKQVECNPADGKLFSGDGNMSPLQKAIMFHGGRKSERVEGTLFTVLLGDEALSESSSGYGDKQT